MYTFILITLCAYVVVPVALDYAADLRASR